VLEHTIKKRKEAANLKQKQKREDKLKLQKLLEEKKNTPLPQASHWKKRKRSEKDDDDEMEVLESYSDPSAGTNTTEQKLQLTKER